MAKAFQLLWLLMCGIKVVLSTDLWALMCVPSPLVFCLFYFCLPVSLWGGSLYESSCSHSLCPFARLSFFSLCELFFLLLKFLLLYFTIQFLWLWNFPSKNVLPPTDFPHIISVMQSFITVTYSSFCCFSVTQAFVCGLVCLLVAHLCSPSSWAVGCIFVGRQ